MLKKKKIPGGFGGFPPDVKKEKNTRGFGDGKKSFLALWNVTESIYRFKIEFMQRNDFLTFGGIYKHFASGIGLDD